MNNRTFSWLLVIAALTIANILHRSNALRCPKRSSDEADKYNVQSRLDKIFGDIGYVCCFICCSISDHVI